MSEMKRTDLPFNPSIGSVDSYGIEYKPGDRLAECMFCGTMSKSEQKLPFWRPRPQQPYDMYYDGCRGFD